MTSLMAERGIYWDQMCASSLVVILPVLILAIIVQKHIVRDLTFGVVK